LLGFTGSKLGQLLGSGLGQLGLRLGQAEVGESIVEPSFERSLRGRGLLADEVRGLRRERLRLVEELRLGPGRWRRGGRGHRRARVHAELGPLGRDRRMVGVPEADLVKGVLGSSTNPRR
jgi:hypothetical protein